MKLAGLFLVLAVTAPAASCTRRIDVSCDVEWLGMCHEWLQRTPLERRELKEAVCHKSDERFSEQRCRRDGALGSCELEGERTFFYRGRVPAGFDAAATCQTQRGRWQPTP
jgi:hypothetical protein